MTRQQAKEILLLYRPGTADAEDPEVIEAISLARQDQELGEWFEEHCAFQTAMRDQLRSIEVPAHLKTALLVQKKILPLPESVPPQRSWAWLAAAAVLVAFCGLLAIWLRPSTPNQFSNFEARMLSSALRDYRMDIKTNDMTQVRQFLASQGAPSDYVLTKGLRNLSLTGGGTLRWRNNPVSMVCFNRGDNQMLFLFVTSREAVKDPPPPAASAQVIRSHNYVCIGWSSGDKAYLLAGPDEPEFVQKYF